MVHLLSGTTDTVVDRITLGAKSVFICGCVSSITKKPNCSIFSIYNFRMSIKNPAVTNG